jgi:hypothetical protein
MRMSLVVLVCGIAIAISLTRHSLADGPADNQLESVRPLPPPGIKIDDAVRKELEKDYESLRSILEGHRASKNEFVIQYLPDVEIFEKALKIALFEDGFFEPRDVESAKQIATVGLVRAKWLRSPPANTIPPWVELHPSGGSTVRGYRSQIDGSVQPYGVAWTSNEHVRDRADVWCRGRSEKGLELQFIAQHLTNPSPKPVRQGLFIYPLGRYCNANKLAGEVDTLEALEHAVRSYGINRDRIAIRGFSMGGAAAWHLAVHYPDKWFAATPGAGFSETPQFLKVFQSESLTPSPNEQILWRLYDCPGWVLNLKNLPTIAYSGELDRQKQAADVMADACWNLPALQRFELTHIVAPKTAHKIAPEARDEIESRLDGILASQETGPPKHIAFTTYTLKYNRCHWVKIERLKQHWEQATVFGHLTIEGGIARIDLHTKGVDDLSVDFAPGELPNHIHTLSVHVAGDARLDYNEGQISIRSDRSWNARFRLNESGLAWKRISPLESDTQLRKRHNLQGPIDDAFMSSFLFVKPKSTGQHPETDKWVTGEFERAVREWHRQMRGDVRVVSVDDLKETDIQNNHIVLWGDPVSNPMIAKVLEKLPIKWDAEKLAIADKSFESAHHVPVLIYPNPLSPHHYVVLNSSLTYREYDYLNNARQVPKLPDWAMVDIRTAPNARWPGKIALDGFFGEDWEVKPMGR